MKEIMQVQGMFCTCCVNLIEGSVGYTVSYFQQ
ncbi:hypothetical protein GGGNBK_12645 [Sporosarcina sp. ANT_H38]